MRTASDTWNPNVAGKRGASERNVRTGHRQKPLASECLASNDSYLA